MFCVVIPTHNRPDQLALALDSVMRQSLPPDEIVVVDDGSDSDPAARNAALVRALGPRGRLVVLPAAAGGRGPAASRNAGIAASAAPYICFLDDDDVWTDADYLQRLRTLIDTAAFPFDIHFALQHAYRGGQRLHRAIWIEELAEIVAHRAPGAAGSHEVEVEELLRCTGFCHLNATCVRRAFMEVLRGFDPRQRYESDREFYLRAIDAARSIRFTPVVVARHNAPYRDRADNVSTALSDRGRQRQQLRLLQRTASSCRHPEIRAYAAVQMAWTLKKLAIGLARDGDLEGAHHAARAALRHRFSLRWAAFTLLVALRKLPAAMRRAGTAAAGPGALIQPLTAVRGGLAADRPPLPGRHADALADAGVTRDAA